MVRLLKEKRLAHTTASATRTMVSHRRRRGLLRLGLVAVLVTIGFGYISPAYNYYTRTGEVEKEKAAFAELENQNRRLLMEKEGLQDGSRVESVAREELGLVKPGEQPYIVKDIESQPEVPEAAAPAEAASAAPAEHTGFLTRLFSDG